MSAVNHATAPPRLIRPSPTWRRWTKSDRHPVCHATRPRTARASILRAIGRRSSTEPRILKGMRAEPLGDSAYILRDLEMPAYELAERLNAEPQPGLIEAVASYETV